MPVPVPLLLLLRLTPHVPLAPFLHGSGGAAAEEAVSQPEGG